MLASRPDARACAGGLAAYIHFYIRGIHTYKCGMQLRTTCNMDFACECVHLESGEGRDYPERNCLNVGCVCLYWMEGKANGVCHTNTGG